MGWVNAHLAFYFSVIVHLRGGSWFVSSSSGGGGWQLGAGWCWLVLGRVTPVIYCRSEETHKMTEDCEEGCHDGMTPAPSTATTR